MDVRLELALGAGAAVDWRELVVLGRTGEPPGQATLRWDVTRPRTARTLVASPTAVAQRIDEHTVLVRVLDDDAAQAGRALDELCARARG